MLKQLLLTSCAVLLAGNAFAYTVSVNYNNGITWNTTALTGYQTTGSMMDGMNVTARFADGSTQTAVWGSTGGSSGAATAANFLLSQGGDTFQNTWSLRSTGSLVSLQIDAGAGDTVFDVLSSDFLSPGSYLGRFDVSSASDNLNIAATFSGAVSVNNVFYGDLYRYLTFNFTNAGGFAANNYLNFYADTDNLLYAGDITPTVPEPSTLFLLGGGLAGLAIWRRKKQAK